MPRSLFSACLVGEESLLLHCAEKLVSDGHQIVRVVSANPAIIQWSRARKITVGPPVAGWAELLGDRFDYLFNIAGTWPLSESALRLPRRLAIDFHDGPLPEAAGVYPTAWAILRQRASHGVTWYTIPTAGGRGRILKQQRFELRSDETSYTLNSRCYETAISSFGELIEALANSEPSGSELPRHWESPSRLFDRPPRGAQLSWRDPARTSEACVRALDFGRVDNPLALPKLVVGEELALVRRARLAADQGTAEPGTVVAVTADGLSVATSEGTLRLEALSDPAGEALDISEFAERHALAPGSRLPELSEAQARRVSQVHERLARHEPDWVRRLANLRPARLPQLTQVTHSTPETLAVLVQELPRGLDARRATFALCAFFARIVDGPLDVAYRDTELDRATQGAEAHFASHVPLRVAVDLSRGWAEAEGSLAAELDFLHARGSFARDCLARYSELSASSDDWASTTLVIERVTNFEAYRSLKAAALVLAVADDGRSCRWSFDAQQLPKSEVESLLRQFACFAEALLADPEQPLVELPLFGEAEREQLLYGFNQTQSAYQPACIHTLFEQQVARTPTAIALVHEATSLTFRELDARATRLARRLAGSGVGPDVLVGISVERSPDLVIAALGIMKAGGAYLPLDPSYPRGRLEWMLEDSRLRVLVTQRALAARYEQADLELVLLDAEREAAGDIQLVGSQVRPEHLAYVIYTSGSTGRPKGVMVEHRNVANFFHGMDQRLEHQPGEVGTWLSVTSLSFDISVLELFWSLTRGFKVVLHSDRADGQAAPGHQRHADREIGFSLMYFASDEGENASSRDKYRLLLDGARFADEHGFVAVWTPERHFHAFGGLYPNPSVAGAAIASITKRVGIRAASVVMPLHPPVRVAEEWALVDNLSDGRVGISFASGWQPNDFIIYKPERFQDRKQVMLEGLEQVRALWRGEKLKALSPLGKEIEVTTLPRPVQPELPFWLTAAGNPETFRAAGEIGANLLTHLLGQSVAEVAEKIAVYREARRQAGHSGPGIVSMMLHTFVGLDAAQVRATVREPLKAYLKSSVQLIKLAAWSFPTFQQKADRTGKTPAELFEQEDLSEEDMDALLEHSFNRYYETSGLFGTPEQCVSMVDRLKGIGVDEIGCLLDYGVPSSKVLEHLPYIDQVKQLTRAQANASADYSFASQVARHRVTHFQCTPSQLAMLLASDDSRAALASLHKLMVGGEALPIDLARQLAKATSAKVLNMYGPTETTVWSSTAEVVATDAKVSIGRPIANTRIYLLDARRQPVPLGSVGHLWIAGDGVTRGYHQRPELTQQRFVPEPWTASGARRMYATGDLARYRSDGSLEFLGRLDSQVKLRGHRIELAEIEAQLRQLDRVRDAVVLLREDAPGDQRLVAYVTGAAVDPEHLRRRLEVELPPVMIPSHFVVLERMPLTPNAKIDRRALPPPERAQASRRSDYVRPDGAVQQVIARVWGELLNVERVGLDDNFFDLGGHSLLTVQVHRRLRDECDKPLALTDLFRFPTIRALAEFLEGDGAQRQTLEQSQIRARARKAARSKLAAQRQRRRRAQGGK